MKNIHFVIDKKNNVFEFWVDGQCITDCFSLTDGAADLMEQLIQFADVPCYKEISFEEVEKILLLDN